MVQAVEILRCLLFDGLLIKNFEKCMFFADIHFLFVLDRYIILIRGISLHGLRSEVHGSE